MINPGTILGGRYEISGKIGTGGMADVYKGRDLKLNRFVAVKVLKSEFSSNKNFVSKFKVEAQSAAGLMHHNIVNVYDVGEENGLYYFVMELVEGITLKSYIEKKIRLSYKEALSIAIQVSNGIEAAHNNGIIHRDIKPQNIIISREGKVKVADFGIARAASSDTITSQAMGSVHYTSPEQARGGYSDAKSDIYSIGITLFEMITGRVPFDGETTVAIAIKHIQEEMPPIRNYVPDIPISVEKIILKCTQKNPDRRYYNISELIKDLKRACTTPDEDFVVIQDARSNAGTKVLSDDESVGIQNEVNNNLSGLDYGYGNQAPQHSNYPQYNMGIDYDDGNLNSIPIAPVRQEPYFDEEDENLVFDSAGWQERSRQRERERMERDMKRKPKNKSKNKQEHTRERVNAQRTRQPERRRYDSELDDDMDPKMEKLTTIIMIVAAIVVALVAIFIVLHVANIDIFGGSSSALEDVEEGYTIVPNVVGLDINAASKALEEAHLKAKATKAPSPDYDKDYIISQDIEEGTKVEENTELKIVISSGKVEAGMNVPDVVGKTEAEARVALENEGFTMKKELTTSDTVEAGLVVSQSPLGATSAPRGSEITVYISEGPDIKTVEVPDLVGKDKETAVQMIEAANLLFGTATEENNDTVEAGLVLSQTIAAGTTVDEGTTVDITVSKGPAGYTCSYAISAPADYLAGTDAVITLTDPSVTVELAREQTNSFPYSFVKTGITGFSSGAITVTYMKVDGSYDTTVPANVTFTQD